MRHRSLTARGLREERRRPAAGTPPLSHAPSPSLISSALPPLPARGQAGERREARGAGRVYIRDGRELKERRRAKRSLFSTRSLPSSSTRSLLFSVRSKTPPARTRSKASASLPRKNTTYRAPAASRTSCASGCAIQSTRRPLWSRRWLKE